MAEISGTIGDPAVKRLASLPIIQTLMDRLKIREIVDGLCPIRSVADFSHGQMVEVLVANRLTSPRPLYIIEGWAEEWAVEEVFGVRADQLNDDRLGRTLDAIADQISPIQGSVSAGAIAEFKLDVRQMNLDITSFMFEGQYLNGDPDFPQVARGYNAQKDYKRKQVRTGLATTSDGGVPLSHQVFDGNRTDTNTLMQTFQAMRSQLPQLQATAELTPEVLVVGDTKLIAKGNLLKLLEVDGVRFVAPLERGPAMDIAILERPAQAWQELSYASEAEQKRREKRPPEEWNRFWHQERESKVTDPKTGKEYQLRDIFILSEEEQRAVRKHRERQMSRADTDLERISNGIGRYYKTEDHAKKKVEGTLRDRRVSGLYSIDIGTRDGVLYFSWARDTEAVEREERLDGRYVLQTNLEPAKSANDVLTIQKGQYRIEHRFSHWKGPLEVRPLFLKSNGRIAAMILVTFLALQVYCLMEREVRRLLADEQGYAQGFYPENRRSRPTGAKILEKLDNVMALIGPGGRVTVCNLRGMAAKLYDAFNVRLDDLKGG